MSDIFRKMMGPPPVEMARHTTKELARLCHEAEDTGDDVLLIEVQAEVQYREARLPGATRLFMDWYWILWREREANRRGTGT